MTTKAKASNNGAIVDRIVVLVEEVALLKSRFTDHDTGHLRTAVNVLENRVQELREQVQ
tara:strand:+ start:6160 stop:6336 length:177 start_codon:yes stop_codon:yes gene_type:complete